MNNDDLFAIAVLAKREAKKAVKRQLQSRGIKLSYVPFRDICELARDYLAQHRTELVALATAQWKAICKHSGRC